MDQSARMNLKEVVLKQSKQAMVYDFITNMCWSGRLIKEPAKLTAGLQAICMPVICPAFLSYALSIHARRLLTILLCNQLPAVAV